MVFASIVVCPVFNDKHLSWSYDLAREMVDTANEMGFPLMAGSSLPITARMPAIDLPHGVHVEEALSLGVGGPDGYDSKFTVNLVDCDGPSSDQQVGLQSTAWRHCKV